MKARMGWSLVGACMLGGCTGHEVIRVVDGVPTPGRYVSASAYAAYIQGAEQESRGQLQRALATYLVAIERDPASVALWVRVGDLRCRQNDVEGAEEAFAEAEARGPRYEPLWRARALCARSRGQREAALAHARRAVAENPRRVETVVLLAELLLAGGKEGEARRYLHSLALQHPHRTAVWRAVLAASEGDPVWTARAEAALRRLPRELGRTAQNPPAPGLASSGDAVWREVDTALRRGELDLARRRMRQVKLDHRLLAARALLLGEVALARREAALRLSANPQESDARVALALSADLGGDGAQVAAAMAGLPARLEGLSESGRWMMAELLYRRAGPDAARAWEAAATDVPEVRRRLAEALEAEAR